MTPAFVLIDCGVFKGTPKGSIRVKAIAEDIFLATNEEADGSGRSRLELLVVTHEHWDHISGFHESQGRATFENPKLQVGAVWLPWTEDNADSLARQLRGLKARTAKALKVAYKEMRDRGLPNDGPALRVRSALNMLGFGDDSGELGAEVPDGFDRTDGAGEALSWIKQYFRNVVRYVEPGPDPKHDGQLPGVPGVRFYALGPPKDGDLIRRLNPREKDDEAYSKTKGFAAAVESAFFAAFGVTPTDPTSDDLSSSDDPRLADEERRQSRPFDATYRVDLASKQAEEHPFFGPRYFDKNQEWRRIDTEWLAAAGQFALNVDGLANNSSLVLAIELSRSGRVLLFPGDAQIGNWLSWFGKVKYPGGDDRGKDMTWTLEDGRKVDAKDLLARTVLYKVGHHGSHNATLKRGGLEAMGTRWPDEFVAMLPVDENLARNHTTYGEMPLTSLVYDLLGRTGGRLFRSDESNLPETPARNPKLVPTILGVDDRKPLDPKKFKNRSDDPDGLYFDYTIFDDE
jgi:glyoxylase-like metal-dependent hydrolase (beta-lactamase superfamily II)